VKRRRHTLAALTPEDDGDGGGRPLLFGYGLEWIAAAARRTKRTVRRARVDGIPLHDPVEAVAWIVSRRGAPEFADELLELLGRSARYVGADDGTTKKSVAPVDPGAGPRY